MSEPYGVYVANNRAANAIAQITEFLAGLGDTAVIPVGALRYLMTEYEVQRAALAIARERIKELEAQVQTCLNRPTTAD